MRNFLFASLLVLTTTAYGQYDLLDFKPLYRLTAAWEMKTKKGFLIEQWVRMSDSLMTSKSYRIVGKDTIPEETVVLKFSKGEITFTPTVPNQNENKPVPFTLIAIDGNKYTFENKEHDFPQRIIYSIGEKYLNVTINGNTKDGFKEIPFDFILK